MAASWMVTPTPKKKTKFVGFDPPSFEHGNISINWRSSPRFFFSGFQSSNVIFGDIFLNASHHFCWGFDHHHQTSFFWDIDKRWLVDDSSGGFYSPLYIGDHPSIVGISFLTNQNESWNSPKRVPLVNTHHVSALFLDLQHLMVETYWKTMLKPCFNHHKPSISPHVLRQNHTPKSPLRHRGCPFSARTGARRISSKSSATEDNSRPAEVPPAAAGKLEVITMEIQWKFHGNSMEKLWKFDGNSIS